MGQRAQDGCSESRRVSQIPRDTTRMFWKSKRSNVTRRELSMPPLSSLSINPQQHQQQPAHQGYQSTSGPASYYVNQQSPPQPQPIRQPVIHSPPAEAQIQSWADNLEQEHPKPKPPPAPVANMGGAWLPEMGIKFAPAPAGGAGSSSSGGSGPHSKTWEPSKGIRFG